MQMDKNAQIAALKRIQDEVDEMTSRIEDIVKENEITIADNIEAKCARIKEELEEIYEMTDKRVYGTRHFSVKVNEFYWSFAFEGKQKRHYFLNKDDPDRFSTDEKEYHVVIGKCTDASGQHYYEDGTWSSQSIKELIASDWEEIREAAENAIVRAYEWEQKETLRKNMDKLRESEKRLARTEV